MFLRIFLFISIITCSRISCNAKNKIVVDAKNNSASKITYEYFPAILVGRDIEWDKDSINLNYNYGLSPYSLQIPVDSIRFYNVITRVEANQKVLTLFYRPGLTDFDIKFMEEFVKIKSGMEFLIGLNNSSNTARVTLKDYYCDMTVIKITPI